MTNSGRCCSKSSRAVAAESVSPQIENRRLRASKIVRPSRVTGDAWTSKTRGLLVRFLGGDPRFFLGMNRFSGDRREVGFVAPLTECGIIKLHTV